MKVVIDIPDYDLQSVENGSIACGIILKAVKNGIILPEGHGDLIDREKFLKSFLDSFWGAVKEGNSSFEVVGAVKNIIRNTPTVIEADKEKSDDI